MDEVLVREHAQAFADALVAGDVDRAITDFSKELRQNLGEVISLLPLPATSATIESVERSGSGDNVAIRVVGESEEILIQTRWKDRDDKPTIIELSHLTRTAIAAAAGEVLEETEGEGEAAETDGDEAG